MSTSIPSRIQQVTPIIRSQTPPACDEWGALKSQSQPSEAKYDWISLLSISLSEAWSSLYALTKLVPQSEQSCITGPHKARNLHNALIKLEESIDSISSMCMALVVRQVNSTAQRLLFATPPLVHRALTYQGLKTSRPTSLNGGAGVNRSTGRSAFF